VGVDLIVCITGHVQDHLLANSYVDLRYVRSGLHISDDPPILHKWIEGARKRKLERTRRPIIAADVARFGDETAISRLDMGLPRAHELTLAQLWDLTAEEVAQRSRASNTLRGAQGSRPRHLRPHDQLVTASMRARPQLCET
jgi:hypothetical protein